MTCKSYESISFEVEEGLKKPEQFYRKTKIEDIFS